MSEHASTNLGASPPEPPPPTLASSHAAATATTQRGVLRRLLVRKIWRAFPELDSYADADCVAFVSLARRRAPRRRLHAAAVAMVLLGSIFGSLLVFSAFKVRVDRIAEMESHLAYIAYLVMFISGMIAICGAPPLAALVVRDLLLRSRVRHILRDTGSCLKCGYSLVGLPVPDSLKINCPECGFVCTVDISLSALAREHTGAVGVDGADRSRWVIVQTPPYWTPERKRIWKRIGIGFATAFIVLTGGPLAGYEVWLRLQAAQARADMPTIEDVSTLIAKHRPGLELVTHPVAIDVITRIGAQMRAIEQQVRVEEGTSPDTSSDFSCVVPWTDPDDPDSGHPRVDPVDQKFTARLLDAYTTPEMDALFAELRAAPRQVRDQRTQADALSAASNQRYLSFAHRAASLLAARVRLAISRGDTESAELCMATIRALRTTCSDQPSLQEWRVANDIEDMEATCAQRWLASRPSAEELDALGRALACGGPASNPSLASDLDALRMRALLADVYADPSSTRLAPLGGAYLPALFGLGSKPIPSPGTWATNRDAIEANRARLELQFKRSLPERNDAPGISPKRSEQDATLAEILLARGVNRGPLFDWSETETAAKRGVTTLMLALERHRVHRGHYPETLADLTPEYLVELPSDPTSGIPLSYRRIDAGLDFLGRPYLIYIFGLDGQDNGGSDSLEFDDPSTRELRWENAFMFNLQLPRTDRQLNIAPAIPRSNPADTATLPALAP